MQGLVRNGLLRLPRLLRLMRALRHSRHLFQYGAIVLIFM